MTDIKEMEGQSSSGQRGDGGLHLVKDNNMGEDSGTIVKEEEVQARGGQDSAEGEWWQNQ